MSEAPAHQRFLAELKRRRVFRVAAVYGAASFAVLQAVDIMAEGLALPDGILRIVTILVLVGFPVTLVAAWVYERTPGGGLVQTREAAAGEIEEIVAQPAWRRWLPGMLALGGIVLFGLGAWLVGGRILGGESGDTEVEAPRAAAAAGSSIDPAAPDPAPAGAVVGIVPFGVQGSDEVTYLGDGLVNILSTKLDGAGDLRMVDPHTIVQAVERDGLSAGSPETGRRIAQDFGASHFIVGDVFEAGGRIQISASLYEQEGREAIAVASVEGSEAEMFGMIDDLAAQLVTGFAAGPGGRVRRTAAVTTESLSALKAFVEGEQQFRRAQMDSAALSFERAIAEDSAFGLAYYRLSVVSEWNLQHERALAAAEQAVRHLDRLPERDRRMLEVYLTRIGGDNLAAAQGYRSLISYYPDELEAWLDLSEVQFHTYPLYGRPMTEARPTIERMLELDPDHASALIHLTRLDLYEDRWQSAIDNANRVVAQGPSPIRIAELEAVTAAAAHDPDLAAPMTARMDDVAEVGVSIAAYTACFSRNWPVCEAISKSLTSPHRSEESRRIGAMYMSSLEAAQGRWERARQELETVAEHSPVWALEQEALLAVTPLAPVSPEQLEELAERIQELDPATAETSRNPNVIFAARDDIHPAFRAYVLGLLRARLGEEDRALAMADSLGAMQLIPMAGSLAPDLASGVRATVHAMASRDAEALAELESMENAVWYPLITGSSIWARAYERYLRGSLLARAGRLDEADSWLESVGRITTGEINYYGPALLLRAEIAERRGEVEAASGFRAELDALWADADPGVREAAGLVRS